MVLVDTSVWSFMLELKRTIEEDAWGELELYF